MPELPEVEIAARQLRAWTAGRSIVSFELLDPRLLKEPDALPALAGARFGVVTRRGKYLILPTDRADLVMHFRMTGKVVPDRASQYSRLRIGLDDGLKLAFEDARRLGELRVLPPGAAPTLPALAAMGPEPWPERQSGGWWAARFVGARGPIKPALLDQSRVAGLGNIAASELLFRARISPVRPTSSLSAAEWERLGEAAHSFLHDTVNAEEGGEVMYLNQGGAENPFAVYGREGELCPRCKAPILRFVQAGRSTFACSSCQRGVID